MKSLFYADEPQVYLKFKESNIDEAFNINEVHKMNSINSLINLR